MRAERRAAPAHLRIASARGERVGRMRAAARGRLLLQRLHLHRRALDGGAHRRRLPRLAALRQLRAGGVAAARAALRLLLQLLHVVLLLLRPLLLLWVLLHRHRLLHRLLRRPVKAAPDRSELALLLLAHGAAGAVDRARIPAAVHLAKVRLRFSAGAAVAGPF